MMGLGPMERRELRQTIVGQFFSVVGDKQVADLDTFFAQTQLAPFNYRGISYHPTSTSPVPFYRHLADEHRVGFEKYLSIYSGLEMEMASLSSLLTRLFRKCNSLKDMEMVLPDVLKDYLTAIEMQNPPSDDYLTLYLTQEDIDALHDEPANKAAISQIKVRAMRDEVFK